MNGRALSLSVLLWLLAAFGTVKCSPLDACNVTRLSYDETGVNASLQKPCSDDSEIQSRSPPESHSKSFLEAAAAASILLRQLQDSQDQESPFTTQEDLDRWGWSRFFAAREEIIPYDLRIPFKSLGISAESPPNTFWQHIQDRQFQRDGQTKNPTGGRYRSFHNARGGAITVIAADSPLANLNFIRSNPKNAPLLSHWSDVTAIQWRESAQWFRTDTHNLKHVFFHFVTTKATRDVVYECLGLNTPNWGGGIDEPAKPHSTSSHSTQKPWPGARFSVADSIEGRALMGTAHGRAVTRMLLHHRQLFGKKLVESVVYFSYSGTAFGLLFELGDAG